MANTAKQPSIQKRAILALMSIKGESVHDRLPDGYTFGISEGGTLVLKDPEGRVIGRFVLTAFGPDPQTLLQFAQDDLLRRRRQRDAPDRTQAQ